MRGAGGQRVAQHHPGHVGVGLDLQAHAHDIAAAPGIGRAALHRAHAAGKSVAGEERRLQRHGGERLHRDPRPAGAFVARDQRAGLTRPGQQQLARRARRRSRCPRSGSRARPRSGGRRPVHRARRVAKLEHAAPTHHLALEDLGKSLQREHAPQICRGGAPGPALLPRERAIHEPRHIVLPLRRIHRRQHQAGGVAVGAFHQPPPLVVIGLGGKAQRCAALGEAAAHEALHFGQAGVALGRIGASLQGAPGVEQRRGGPGRGRKCDRAPPAGFSPAVAREGLERGQLAHFEVGPRRGEAPLQPPFDEGGEAIEHRIARALGQAVAGLVRGAQQKGGEVVAAARCAARRGGKVVGQALAVEIARQLFAQGLPCRLVAQRERARDFLFEATVGVGFKEALQSRQRAGQTRLQHHMQPTAAGQAVGGGRHRHADVALKRLQRGLQHTHGHGGRHGLDHLEAVARRAAAAAACAAAARAGPRALLGRTGRPLDARGARRHIHRPAHFKRGTRGQRHHLRRKAQGRRCACGTTTTHRAAHQRRAHPHRSRRAVAQREAGIKPVALAREWRQAAQHL